MTLCRSNTEPRYQMISRVPFRCAQRKGLRAMSHISECRFLACFGISAVICIMPSIHERIPPNVLNNTQFIKRQPPGLHVIGTLWGRLVS